MEIALFGTLAVLALVDATSIGTLGVPVFLLAARIPINRILLFLATIAGFYVVVGIALMLGFGTLVDTVFSSLRDAIGTRAQGMILIVVGGVLFLASEWIERAKRKKPERSWIPSGTSARAFVVLALSAGMVEVAMMIPYLSAIGILSTSELGVGMRVLTLLGYSLLMIVPALLLVGLTALLGRLMRPVLDRLGAWIRRNADTMLSWTLGAVGVILALNGLGMMF